MMTFILGLCVGMHAGAGLGVLFVVGLRMALVADEWRP